MEKSILIIGLTLLLSTIACEQGEPREFEYQKGDTTFTMKQYVFCLYLSGSNRSQSEEEGEALQKEHLAHLSSLKDHGLVMAGPFGDDGEKRGILLFDLETVEDANALVEKDPMVIDKRLDFDCHPLWLAKGTTLK